MGRRVADRLRDPARRPVGGSGRDAAEATSPDFERTLEQAGTFCLFGGSGLFVVSLLVGSNALLLFACASLITLAIVWWGAGRGVERLEVHRIVPTRATVRLPTTIRWRLQRADRRDSIGVHVLDRLGGPTTPRALDLDVPFLAGDSPHAVAVDVTWLARGRMRLRSARVTSRFPFGLVSAQCTLSFEDEVLVRPAEGRPGRRWRDWLARGSEDPVRVDARSRVEEELFGVRAWREGDEPRRIHARTSARRGEPVVTEWRGALGEEVILVLGVGGAPPDFERAVSATATLWRALLRSGRPARLILDQGEAGTIVRPHAGAPARPLAAGLDALALVARDGRSPRAALERRPPGADVALVYVAAREEAGLADALGRVVGRRGRVLIVRAFDRSDLARTVEGLA